MDYNDIKQIARAIVEEMDSIHNADLAPKWEGGSIFFLPKNSDTRDHELPIDKLFHKIVMIRDNLRVLEQQINSNDNLSEGEKVKYQSYITKCYGSMTSFNFLFYDEEDKFKSKK
ncbi:MAG: hypothetical protein KIT33_03665 [Candidatus Kapabacteria bacterium]|nr:hypothetical protein [Ignavibacteriota bacterium]MCW5884050.1 hypothetical protein [Candidatus Kapabacteria bacterium]